MMLKLWTINLALFVTVSGAFVFAQSQPLAQRTDDNCQHFKMRVQPAPDNVDQSMLIAETNERVRALGKVIDPCRSTNVPVRVKPLIFKPFQFLPTAPKMPLAIPTPIPIKP